MARVAMTVAEPQTGTDGTAGARRLADVFSRASAADRAAFIPYVVAGYPDAETSVAIALAVADAGADILEIGLPADAWLDGPAIQAQHRRAKARGIDAAKSLADVAEFRRRDAATPIVLMGYGETLRAYGIGALAEDAAKAGADAMLFIASAPEELEALDRAARANDIALIRVAFGEEEATWREQIEGARGFVYVPAAAGATGGAEPTAASVTARLARLRKLTPLPLLAGFGVRTPEMFAALAPHADAIAVGTAFAREIEAGLDAAGKPTAALSGRVCALARRLAAAGVRNR
jgi:tryptophan synthase alpha chain